MVRDNWINLNGTVLNHCLSIVTSSVGLWEFSAFDGMKSPSFGHPLNGSILVPFPVESCLSGVGLNYQHLFYRKIIPKYYLSGRTILHFDAVDWQTSVFLNGISVRLRSLL